MIVHKRERAYAMSSVEYEALEKTEREDRLNDHVLNGVGPYPDCCASCDKRLHLIVGSRDRDAYRVRGNDGRVITSDFLAA